MALGSVSLNMFWNPSIKGSNFLQASLKGIHTYAKKVDKVNILGGTKFPLLNRHMNQLNNNLGRIRSQVGKISANPLDLGLKSQNSALKDIKRDMGVVERSAKQTAFYSRKNAENIKQASLSSRLSGGVKNKAKIGVGIAGASVVGAMMSLNPIRKAIDFESDMADVTKATNASKPQTLQLKNNILSQANKGSLLTPSQIAQIQAGGGRSGVAMANLPQFTSDIAKASVAMDLSTEESGRQFAKMAERLNLPIGKINIMTNAFTHLENNGANSARDLINTTGRLAGVFKELDFKPKNSAALSNYMNTLEVSPELAATSFKILANRLKKTNSEFGYFDRLKTQGASSLKGIIKDITSQMNSEEILKKFGSQGANIITKMSGDFKNLDKSLALVSGSSFMGAVEAEYKIKVSTTGAKETMALNRINAQSIVIGDKLKTHYIAMFDTLSRATLSTISLYESNKELINTVGSVVLKMTAVAISIKALKMIGSPFVSLIGGAWKFRNQLKTGFIFAYKLALSGLSVTGRGVGVVMSSMVGFMRTFSLVTSLATAKQWLFNIALNANPIGLVVLGISALITAGVLLYKNWDVIKAKAGSIWGSIVNTIKSPFVTFFNWIDAKFQAVMGVVNKVKGLASSVTDMGSNAWNGTKDFLGFGDDKPKKLAPVKAKDSLWAVKPKAITPINNIDYKKTMQGVPPLKEIPIVPLESPSEITSNYINETKTQMQNNSNTQGVNQNITNQITVHTGAGGQIDYEDLKEKLAKAQKELAHDEQDLQMQDVS